MLGRLIYYHCLLQWRQLSDYVQSLLFLVLLCCLFPLTLDTPQLLSKLAAGLIWLSALLVLQLRQGCLFEQDAQEGLLQQIIMRPYHLYPYVLAKLISFWLLAILPLLVLSPLLALLLQLTVHSWCFLCISLLLGTPALCCLLALGAALTCQQATQNVLAPLIIFPLSVPILILACGSVHLAANHNSAVVPLCLLAAFSILSVSTIPWLITLLFRINPPTRSL